MRISESNFAFWRCNGGGERALKGEGGDSHGAHKLRLKGETLSCRHVLTKIILPPYYILNFLILGFNHILLPWQSARRLLPLCSPTCVSHFPRLKTGSLQGKRPPFVSIGHMSRGYVGLGLCLPHTHTLSHTKVLLFRSTWTLLGFITSALSPANTACLCFRLGEKLRKEWRKGGQFD